MAELSFWGGVGTVTGANFLLTFGEKKILIDCGLVQGDQVSRSLNRANFSYNPATIDFLLVTHAHIDHIGRIPKLIKDGFRGRILSTQATKELAEILLADMIKILEIEAQQDGVLPLFGVDDVTKAMSLWQGLSYHTVNNLGDGVSALFKDAGHILGSAMIEISTNKGKIVFTGDLGNSPSLLLPDTEEITDAHYLVMESVYGDRNHQPKVDRHKQLLQTIERVAKNKKTLIIPAFSVERTQMIIYELNEILESETGSLRMPVFLDSPLAIKVTEIYRRHRDLLNDSARSKITAGDDIFNFPGLKFIVQSGESHLIEKTPGPKIILAGSGMSQGGRVIFHESHYLPNPHAEILFVGYQAVGSLGRQLQDGAKEVIIRGEKKKVVAGISSIGGYSSHKDSDHLLEFVETATENGQLKKVFCVMGEPKSALFLVQRIKDNLDVETVYPTLGQTISIDL